MPPKEASKALIVQVKAARRVSVPLLAITTPDAAATIESICDATDKDHAKIVWDVVEGMRARSEAGKEAIGKITNDEGDPTIANPTGMLKLANKLPENAVLFIHLAGRWMVDPAFIQAAWNLRDAFKINHRMVIFLGTSLDLPPELAGDVVMLDEPLPDPPQLRSIIMDAHTQTDLDITDEKLERAVEAIQGLPSFQAEQVVAMSLTKAGMDVPSLWDRKRRQIELTPGLKVNRESVTFSQIGGVPAIKSFLEKILHGKARPNAIVFVDEIEKFIAGSGGADSSGVSQDQLGTLLAYMQDQQAAGCIFVGPPGSAKSMVAKATGNEAGIQTIQLDLGAMKGQYVGQSEHALRNALKVITSVSNGQSLWIATCNAIADLPPELKRRFTLGTYFFDLPDAEEREAIWAIHRKKYELSKPQEMVDDEGWTGAEIKNCCELAWRMGCTLKEASDSIVPVCRSAADQIEKLRKSANGRFLSASRRGVYQQDPIGGQVVKKTGRKMQLT